MNGSIHSMMKLLSYRVATTVAPPPQYLYNLIWSRHYICGFNENLSTRHGQHPLIAVIFSDMFQDMRRLPNDASVNALHHHADPVHALLFMPFHILCGNKSIFSMYKFTVASIRRSTFVANLLADTYILHSLICVCVWRVRIRDYACDEWIQTTDNVIKFVILL